MLKKGTAYPWRWYGFYYALVLLVGFSTLTYFAQGWNNQDYLQKPFANDVYVIKEELEGKTHYNFWRVYAIYPTAVAFLKNTKDYYGSPPSKFDSDDAFIGQVFRVSRSELQQLNEEGNIHNIIRGYGPSRGFNRLVEVEAP